MKWNTSFNILLMLTLSTVVACLAFSPIWELIDWSYPASRVFRRIWMIAVILGLIVCRKHIGLRSPSNAGFQLSKQSLWNLTMGSLVSIGFLLLLSLLYVIIGAWETVSFDSGEFLHDFKNGLIRGTLVAGIEEYIFRGLIFLSIARAWGWKTGAIIASLIFASLHFLSGRGVENMIPSDSLLAGFEVCGLLVRNMASEFELFPDAAGLFVVGLAMCYGVHKSGTLWYSAGLHGMWIAYFTVRRNFFDATGDWSSFMIGNSRLYDGVIPLIAMVVIFPLTAWIFRKKKQGLDISTLQNV